jgi:DNA-directed RNA polymerase subunit RPC12/RpoP
VSRTRTYRCLNCLEHTVSREFDTSHLSVTCPNCESFERFVNEAVYQQFRAFEESPPAELDWERLDRTEKLVVAERLARSTKTIEDFDVVDNSGDREEGDDGGREETELPDEERGDDEGGAAETDEEERAAEDAADTAAESTTPE